MKLLLLIADIDEFNPFKKSVEKYITEETKLYKMPVFKLVYKNIKATAVCFGIGKVNAATGASLALLSEEFDGVINTGWSGAVSGVAKGDVIVAESCVECDFDLGAIGKALGEKPGQEYIYRSEGFLFEAVKKANESRESGKYKFGALGTGDFFLSDKEKAELYKKLFGIKAFDMESAAIASVCRVLDVPYLSIRKISDSADDAAPSDYKESLFCDGNANVFGDIVFGVLNSLQ